MALLLQGYVGASDAEAVELSVVDLRWQMGLGCLGALRQVNGIAANPCQLAGLRAVTIHVAQSSITDRSPGRPTKAARTAAEARARMSPG